MQSVFMIFVKAKVKDVVLGNFVGCTAVMKVDGNILPGTCLLYDYGEMLVYTQCIQ